MGDKMDVGVIVPQGWKGEYDGWDARLAWRRTVAVALQAEALGFESIWAFDHFHTVPTPTDEITFESFTTLIALGALTARVRLGHIVLCAAYRNPALTAKMISALDTITNGRTELGIGAGWKRDEWVSYGYPFRETKERLAILHDHLEVITRMLVPGRDVHATYTGEHASVDDAINVPKPLQRPRVPIMVGGNGPAVTWRLAARYADEVNLDGMWPSEVAEALPIIASRCEEIGRDPSTLRVSVRLHDQQLQPAGALRVERIAGYRELGVKRIQAFIPESAKSDDGLESFAGDCRLAGAFLADGSA
jgi:alkanesulfonate monooxygenase SsuD/methylene tetrahydromethanopterin reductase-like flavin-dependent oxidoreductase (luciferase family)